MKKQFFLMYFVPDVAFATLFQFKRLVYFLFCYTLVLPPPPISFCMLLFVQFDSVLGVCVCFCWSYIMKVCPHIHCFHRLQQALNASGNVIFLDLFISFFFVSFPSSYSSSLFFSLLNFILHKNKHSRSFAYVNFIWHFFSLCLCST